jgi:beta-lactamase superfamily II metal-dependent hydrolase
MLTIEMLPAAYGDALWIEYGDPPRRILIDGGIASTAANVRERLKTAGGRVDLAVVTHVDEDHIAGMLDVLESNDAFDTADFWFNGYAQISDRLGPQQGERLSDALAKRNLHWNKAFKARAAVVPKEGELKPLPLPGGGEIVLLSPTWAKLRILQPIWKEVVEEAGLTPGASKPRPDDRLGKHDPPEDIDVNDLVAEKSKPDTAPANGSSIAFILRAAGKSVLFGADAHPDVVAASLQRLSGSQPVQLDAFKLAHHGSRANLTPALLDRIRCSRFLISSNGTKFGHPDPQSIAWILKKASVPTELFFNYATDYTRPWGDPELQTKHHYKAIFPDGGSSGLRVTLP